MHWLYYKILVKLIPKAKAVNPVIVNKYRILVKVLLGIICCAKRCVAGDSNSASENIYEVMKLYDDMTTINISAGGATCTDYILFFRRDNIGKWVYNRIKKMPVIIWNIGGNHIFKNQMDDINTVMMTLKAMTPKSWNCTLPPIDYNEKIISDVLLMNNLIKNIWGIRVFDLYSFFVKFYPELEPFIMKDPIHWSKTAVKIICNIKEAIT